MREELLKARNGKTQQEVANVLKISQKYLSKIELGQRNPSIKLASKISNYYGVSVDILFGDIFLNKNTP